MIFVSAGHYPSKPGAKWERFVEYDEAVIWAEKLVELLQFDTTPKIHAMLVPTGVLKSKVAFINERIMNGDVALEIHFNAARDANNNPIGKGSETLYYPGSDAGKAFAEKCQEVLAKHYPPDRGVKEGWYRMDPSRGADFFLAKTKCPAVIVAPEFVHRADIIQTRRDECINKLAEFLRTC